MKKFTALMLALMMSLSLVACGNKPDDSNNADVPTPTTTPSKTAARWCSAPPLLRPVRIHVCR